MACMMDFSRLKSVGCYHCTSVIKGFLRASIWRVQGVTVPRFIHLKHSSRLLGIVKPRLSSAAKRQAENAIRRCLLRKMKKRRLTL